MKKQIVFLAFFLMFAITSFAQQATSGVELYRCQTSHVSLKVGDQWVDTTYSNLNYLISFDLDKALVKVDNRIGTEIYLSSQIETTRGKDSDGDEYIKIIWMCRDKNGIVCELTSIDYINLSDRVFQLKYSDCIAIWYSVIIKRGTLVPQTTEEGKSI